MRPPTGFALAWHRRRPVCIKRLSTCKEDFSQALPTADWISLHTSSMLDGRVQQFFWAWASRSELSTALRLQDPVIPSAERRPHSLSLPPLFCGLAYRARLQSMDKLLPDWPALLFNFMLPPGSEHFLLDFRITDSHEYHSQVVARRDRNT